MTRRALRTSPLLLAALVLSAPASAAWRATGSQGQCRLAESAGRATVIKERRAEYRLVLRVPGAPTANVATGVQKVAVGFQSGGDVDRLEEQNVLVSKRNGLIEATLSFKDAGFVRDMANAARLAVFIGGKMIGTMPLDGLNLAARRFEICAGAAR